MWGSAGSQSWWDNPQQLPVPPDTALQPQDPPISPRPGLHRRAAGRKGYGGTAAALCHGPSSQPAPAGGCLVCAMVHQHQYACHLPCTPPLQPICAHTWLRRTFLSPVAAQAHSLAWHEHCSPAGAGLGDAHNSAMAPQLTCMHRSILCSAAHLLHPCPSFLVLPQ